VTGRSVTGRSVTGRSVFGRRWPTIAIGVLAVTSLVACADEQSDTGSSIGIDEDLDSEGDSRTAPDASATDPAASAGRQPEGFTTIRAIVTEADGQVCEVCLWLADDATERGRGLMGVTDLGDAVGMAFRFDEATSGSFYMFQTPTPLSIAWFAPDGAHVGSADMEPCLDTPAGECPLYSPGVSYDLAIEVFDGGLGPLGIGPGSRVELIEGSESERCPAAE
jgi:uncharacterized membrane protein (UPF0127 family)